MKPTIMRYPIPARIRPAIKRLFFDEEERRILFCPVVTG